MSWVADTNTGCIVTIRVAPRASRNRIQGPHGDALKISLRAPPVDGKANKELLSFLADCLGIHPRDLSILSGDASRNKRIHVRGFHSRTIRETLEKLLVS